MVELDLDGVACIDSYMFEVWRLQMHFGCNFCPKVISGTLICITNIYGKLRQFWGNYLINRFFEGEPYNTDTPIN